VRVTTGRSAANGGGRTRTAPAGARDHGGVRRGSTAADHEDDGRRYEVRA
jgi:hypothetical protein